MRWRVGGYIENFWWIRVFVLKQLSCVKFRSDYAFLISFFISLCIFEGIDECIIYEIYQTDRLS